MMMQPKFKWDDRITDPERLMRANARTARINRINANNLRAASRKMIEKHPTLARWHVLEVEKNKEDFVETTLTANGVEVVLPRMAGGVIVRKGKKIELPDQPMFPGYLLVHCVAKGEAYQGLLTIKHVLGFVGGANGYHVVRDQDVKHCQHLAGKLEAPRAATSETFSDGDRARIEFGPFFGMVCLIIAVKHARQKSARVAIDCDGRVFEIERMPIAFLKKL